jgi:hypothetical protein
MAPAPARKSTAKPAAPPRGSMAKAAAPTPVTVKHAAPVHLSVQERHDIGREARQLVPRSSGGVWEPPPAAETRSRCWRSRMPPECRGWCPCATPGCECRR